MARPPLLSAEQITKALSDIPLWRLSDDTPPPKIVRELSAANFVAAVGIINAIAILAESADHHPDILLYGWNKVRVSLSTHDQGGLTELDIALAKKIDELLLDRFL